MKTIPVIIRYDKDEIICLYTHFLFRFSMSKKKADKTCSYKGANKSIIYVKLDNHVIY